MNISVIIPSFNEEENLRILLPQLHRIISSLNINYELIVVDAISSEDESESVCYSNNTKYFRQTKDGYADAFKTGIANSQFDLILVVDADNSQDISKIPQMFKEVINGADVVIGSRYVKGGTTDDPAVSVVMSKLLNYTYRIFLGFKEKDVSTDFRIYKKYMLKEISTECNDFDVIEETLFCLKRHYHSLKVVEIPINYKKRAEGNSKRKLIKFILGYIKLLIRLVIIRIKKKG